MFKKAWDIELKEDNMVFIVLIVLNKSKYIIMIILFETKVKTLLIC